MTSAQPYTKRCVMPERQEKKEKVKVDEIVGVLTQLKIGGKLYLFDTQPLPSSIKKLQVGRSCKVTVVREGTKVIGVKNGNRIVAVKTY